MLYYLALALKAEFSPLNVLTYHTVRAGGAALTGFFICLLIGPGIIRRLRALKIGQHIRQEHVADLHALHKKKEGTPTMGGTLILISSMLSLLLWCDMAKRLLLLAAAALCLLGLVGFLDDYIKLRRRHNRGLSAKTKFAGQILVGLLLGTYLVLYPITPPKTRLARGDISDWEGLARVIRNDLLEHSTAISTHFEGLPLTFTPNYEENAEVLAGLNRLIESADLYTFGAWTQLALSKEGRELVSRREQGLNAQDRQRLNLLVLEAAWPQILTPSVPNLHTKLGVPGFKNWFIPLGAGYALLVLLVIVASSNAVNLTDGLDGLAIGAAIMSIMAYTAIAYVVSRADWSRYLFLVHVPEASELFVFGAALLGAGLGFLWFNSHPAEVFMGDTGSLALGGAIGTMAVLTKQELLLILVGGLFVLEAASVILQVASFKLRGKRVFRMAPLHHHFELMGWSESKVTVRFWILALIFALMSLATLKLR